MPWWRRHDDGAESRPLERPGVPAPRPGNTARPPAEQPDSVPDASGWAGADTGTPDPWAELSGWPTVAEWPAEYDERLAAPHIDTVTSSGWTSTPPLDTVTSSGWTDISAPDRAAGLTGTAWPSEAEIAASVLDRAERAGLDVVGTDRVTPAAVEAVTMSRLVDSLRRLGIRYLTDPDGNLLALWERHAVLFALEGPESDILVMRARALATVPPEWADRTFASLNEWNRTRRFLKAYVGDPTERGQLPLYAEMQVPLIPGAHDGLLDELVDCAAAVSGAWADWLHDEGAVL